MVTPFQGCYELSVSEPHMARSSTLAALHSRDCPFPLCSPPRTGTDHPGRPPVARPLSWGPHPSGDTLLLHTKLNHTIHAEIGQGGGPGMRLDHYKCKYTIEHLYLSTHSAAWSRIWGLCGPGKGPLRPLWMPKRAIPRRRISPLHPRLAPRPEMTVRSRRSLWNWDS